MFCFVFFQEKNWSFLLHCKNKKKWSIFIYDDNLFVVVVVFCFLDSGFWIQKHTHTRIVKVKKFWWEKKWCTQKTFRQKVEEKTKINQNLQLQIINQDEEIKKLRSQIQMLEQLNCEKSLRLDELTMKMNNKKKVKMCKWRIKTDDDDKQYGADKTFIRFNDDEKRKKNPKSSLIYKKNQYLILFKIILDIQAKDYFIGFSSSFTFSYIYMNLIETTTTTTTKIVLQFNVDRCVQLHYYDLFSVSKTEKKYHWQLMSYKSSVFFVVYAACLAGPKQKEKKTGQPFFYFILLPGSCSCSNL